MTYIHFTEEQKYRASCVDLVEFLRRQGEKLIRSGPEYRMASDHSVTVRGNEWYDHAAKEGGGPISFVQNYCGLSYPEAVTRLLEGEQGQIYEPAPRKREEPKKEYAYLLKKRLIDREVLSTFVWAGLIYEDEKYHNAVFAGKDEHGVVRHAHKRSTSDIGKTFRINVEGSDPRYSFHWNGTSDRLYYDAVLWAVEQGITGGTGGGKFSPDTPCTRAQMATFLWRANGSTEVTGTTPFSDVSAETYYYNAVLWAYEQNITNGTGGGKFSPDATCTRAQMVQMLKNASDAV